MNSVRISLAVDPIQNPAHFIDALNNNDPAMFKKKLDEVGKYLSSENDEIQFTVRAYCRELTEFLKHHKKRSSLDLLTLLQRIEKTIAVFSHELEKVPDLYKELLRAYRHTYEAYSDQLAEVSFQLFLEFGVHENPNFIDVNKINGDQIGNYTEWLKNLMERDLIRRGVDLSDHDLTKDSKISDVLETTPELVQAERTLAAERWVGMMRRRFNQGNYFDAMFMFSVFTQNAAVSRLYRTLNGLSAEARETITMVESLLNKGGTTRERLILTRDKPILAPVDYLTAQFGQVGEQLEAYGDIKIKLERENKQETKEYKNLLADLQIFEEKKSTLNNLILKMQTENLLALLEKKIKKKVDKEFYSESPKEKIKLQAELAALRTEKLRLLTAFLDIKKELRQNKFLFSDKVRKHHYRNQLSAIRLAIHEANERLAKKTKELNEMRDSLTSLASRYGFYVEDDAYIIPDEAFEDFNKEKLTIVKEIERLTSLVEKISKHVTQLEKQEKKLRNEALSEFEDIEQFTDPSLYDLVTRTSTKEELVTTKKESDENYQISMIVEPRIKQDPAVVTIVPQSSRIIKNMPVSILGIKKQKKSDEKKLKKLSEQKSELESALTVSDGIHPKRAIEHLEKIYKASTTIKYQTVRSTRMKVSEITLLSLQQLDRQEEIMKSNSVIYDELKKIGNFSGSSWLRDIFNHFAEAYEYTNTKAEKGPLPNLLDLILYLKAELKKNKSNLFPYAEKMQTVLGRKTKLAKFFASLTLAQNLLKVLKHQAKLVAIVEDLEHEKNKFLDSQQDSHRKEIQKLSDVYKLPASSKEEETSESDDEVEEVQTKIEEVKDESDSESVLTPKKTDEELPTFNMRDSQNLLQQLDAKTSQAFSVSELTELEKDMEPLNAYQAEPIKEDKNPKLLRRCSTSAVILTISKNSEKASQPVRIEPIGRMNPAPGPVVTSLVSKHNDLGNTPPSNSNPRHRTVKDGLQLVDVKSLITKFNSPVSSPKTITTCKSDSKLDEVMTTRATLKVN